MKTSKQILGVLVVLASLFAVSFLPLEPRMRAMAAALVLTLGGGTMAFLRSRKISRSDRV